MSKNGDEVYDLNQELVFSIPVYNKFPTSDGEDNAAYPDLNK